MAKWTLKNLFLLLEDLFESILYSHGERFQNFHKNLNIF